MMLRNGWASVLLVLAACGGGDDDAGAAAGAGGASAGGGAGAAGAAQAGAAGTTAAPPGSVTFHEHIEPMLQQRCQSCHHDGATGPFVLTDFASASAVGPLMLARMVDRTMPPWGAFETDECRPRHPFKDDLRLGEGEIAAMKAWVDAGMPEGDPAKAPPAITFPPEGLAGATDTLAAAAPYVVKASSTSDEFRCFVFDPQLDQDTWVNGLQVKPGNARVVHHALVFADPGRTSLAKAKAGDSYKCFGGPDIDGEQKLLLAWAPGAQGTDLGDDIAMKLTKGSLLVMQVHYHPTQTSDEGDQTQLQLRRTGKSPTWVSDVVLLGNASSDKGVMKLLPGPGDPASGPAFVIPPDVSDHTESMEFTFPDKIGGFPLPELHLASVGTHMHLVGRSMRIEIERAKPTDAQPKDECLVETPQWDFNWQRGYAYDRPIAELPTLNAGDKVKLRCSYDNTMNNAFVKKALAEQHLTSTQTVHLGEQTLDEMCLGAFTFFRPNFGE